jgi:hypothetical protein
MLRVVRRLWNAIFVGLAIHHIRTGRSRNALRYLEKVWGDYRKDGLLHAMRAYCYLVVGETQQANQAAERAIVEEAPPTEDREFIVRYGRYIQSVLRDDYASYSDHWQWLKRSPCSSVVADALVVDRLFVSDPTGEAVQ